MHLIVLEVARGYAQAGDCQQDTDIVGAGGAGSCIGC